MAWPRRIARMRYRKSWTVHFDHETDHFAPKPVMITRPREGFSRFGVILDYFF